jgi:hypothetical protein
MNLKYSTFTKTFFVIDRIEKNVYQNISGKTAKLNFRLDSEGKKIDVNYVGLADLINTFGGFNSSFALFASILASIFSDYFYKKEVFNDIFNFIKDKTRSKKNDNNDKFEEEQINRNVYTPFKLKNMDTDSIRNFIENREFKFEKKKSSSNVGLSKIKSKRSNSKGDFVNIKSKKNKYTEDKNYANNNIDDEAKTKKDIENKSIKKDNNFNDNNNEIINDNKIYLKKNYDNNDINNNNVGKEKFNDIELSNFVRKISVDNDINLFDDNDYKIESEKVLFIFFYVINFRAKILIKSIILIIALA